MITFWPFILSFLIYATLAFVAPFQVLFYQGLHFTGPQIGLLVGLAPLITLLTTPFWTGWADANRHHRQIMSLILLGSALALFFLPLAGNFWLVLVLTLLYSIFYAPLASFNDSATLHMLADKKELYGRIRLGGTIGFGLAALVSGNLVAQFDLKAAFWGGVILLLLALVVCQKLEFGQAHSQDNQRTKARFSDLLVNRQWYFFLALAFIGGMALVPANNYLFPYLQELNTSEAMMGALLTFGTLLEIPVLFFGHHLLRRLKPYNLFRLAMIITGIRLILFALSRSATHVLLPQLLNGFSFPAMWLAGVAYADEQAPPGLRTTAQGLLGAMVFGFGAAAGGFIGGALLESISGRNLFYLYGIVTIVATLLISFWQSRYPAQAQPQGEG